MRMLSLAIMTAITTAAAAAEPDFSLTVYSSASPGQLNAESLTGYGGNLPGYALVRDARNMVLDKGRGSLRFTDVAKRIDPTTVSFASLTDPNGTRVIEQNYQFDLVGAQKLLERYLGETITVEQVRGEVVDRISGKLLSATQGMILQRDTGEVVSLNHWTNVLFPSLPGGLITKPTLVWLVDAAQGGEHRTRVSYQTQGMTWWTDYNIILGSQDQDCRMDMAAWVTLVNQAGASFPNAQLKLVAGEVNRAPAPAAPMMRAKAMATVSMEMDDGFQESELFEYHLYTLGRRTDLPDNSTKQLELFPAAAGIACKRQLVFTATPSMWRAWGSPLADQGFGSTEQGTVGAYLEFENRKENKLGLPMPAGRIRVNQAAADGSLEFIGEDVIKHTPRNETIRIKLGNAFDVVGERKQANFFHDPRARYMDETIELSIRNRKKTAARVVAREYLYRWSNWNITGKSHEFIKRDVNTVDFELDIPADGEAKVSYTVRYSW